MWVIAAILVLLIWTRVWLLPHYGDFTIACVLKMHDTCSQHLTCNCHHHDRAIIDEMMSPGPERSP